MRTVSYLASSISSTTRLIFMTVRTYYTSRRVKVMILFCQLPFLLTETCGKILFFSFSDIKKQRHLISCQFSPLNPHSIYFYSVCFELTHFIAELCVTLLFIPCQGPPFYLLLLWGVQFTVQLFAKLPVRTPLRRGHKGVTLPACWCTVAKSYRKVA